MVNLRLGNCLEILPSIPDGSVDLILVDLPYGVTDCKWNNQIHLKPLWEEYERVISPAFNVRLSGDRLAVEK